MALNSVWILPHIQGDRIYEEKSSSNIVTDIAKKTAVHSIVVLAENQFVKYICMYDQHA